ncbi:alpha/beta fold hydrolase [Actinomycetes bacterium KLBMP 9797]
MTAKRWLLAALVLPSLVACDSTPRTVPPTGPPRGKTVTVELRDRPFQLHVPTGYDPAVKAPLVVLLHGYTSSAAEQESYLRLTAEADRRGFLYAMPDGTKDRRDNRFWNATEACCDFNRTGVDDSAYLTQLLDTVALSYSVDTRRVYLVGHSNGGFMAYRMACEHSTRITAIVSLAGAATNDAAQCAPERPVSVLQIHGTADRTIRFEGGANVGRPYPSAQSSLALWHRHNGCGDQAASAAPLDLDSRLPGPETTVTTYRTGCRDATTVALWSIKDGRHIPTLANDFPSLVTDFLLAHTRP